MLHNVRSFIDGLLLPGLNPQFILPAYVDNIVVLIKKQKDVNRLGNIVESFGKIPAAKVN